jgi:hypothetical protein
MCFNHKMLCRSCAPVANEANSKNTKAKFFSSRLLDIINGNEIFERFFGISFYPRRDIVSQN